MEKVYRMRSTMFSSRRYIHSAIVRTELVDCYKTYISQMAMDNLTLTLMSSSLCH